MDNKTRNGLIAVAVIGVLGYILGAATVILIWAINT